MKKLLLLSAALPFLSLMACDQSESVPQTKNEQSITLVNRAIQKNIPELMDNTPNTFYMGTEGMNSIVFENNYTTPMVSYKIFSSGEAPASDPASWELKGSVDGENWTSLDIQKDQTFFSRFQERIYTIQNPSQYKQYLLELKTANNAKLKIGEVTFYDKDILKDWKEFKYPTVVFEDQAPHTVGSKMYRKLVQDPDEYIKYHTQKVAEILYNTDKDDMTFINKIGYTLEDVEGVSAKGGSAPFVTVFYSTQHIEKSSNVSLYKLDYETRGVLYHELVHAYQFEPKGVGDYGNSVVFRACLEGVADAVRAQAGLFDIKADRKPGGHWNEGYRRTGYFIQWLTEKDPDAIRKFNRSAKDLEVWSFDAAMKYIFGNEASIKELWKEYQTAIS